MSVFLFFVTVSTLECAIHDGAHIMNQASDSRQLMSSSLSFRPSDQQGDQGAGDGAPVAGAGAPEGAVARHAERHHAAAVRQAVAEQTAQQAADRSASARTEPIYVDACG